MQPHSPNRARGFSLIEVMVVVAILATVGGALAGLISYFYKSNAYVLEETSAVDSAHRGLTTSFNDLREASYGNDGSYPVSAAATSTVTFYSDSNGDGAVKKIRLYFINGTLYRGVTDSAGNPPSYAGQTEKTYTIATNVVNATSTPIFRYYDFDGSELLPPIAIVDIASISTLIQVDLNPTRAPNVFTLTARATLRNLRN